jgi:hypothetical protein
MKITVRQDNSIGKITFGKISKVEDLRITNMSDVDISGQQDGYVLVYNAAQNNYAFRQVQIVDGGYF